MIDVAQQQTRIRLVDDQTNISTDPHRPEILIFCPVDPMKTQPGTYRIDLQIKRGRLGRLLLVVGKACKAIGECVRDSELHYSFGSEALEAFMI